MSATAFGRAMASAAVGLLAAQSCPVPAITGGVPVDAVLAAGGGSRYTQQQIAFADAVSAVTVALLNVGADGQGRTLCSATIVHPRVVLTAAHCVLNGREVSRRITVLFEGGALRRQALDAIVHPAFLKGLRGRAHPPSAQNSKLDEGAVSGGREIVMLSGYQNGARVNVCSGDSGGPILVLDPATSRLRQLAVTSAADEHCREGAIFAPIVSQRAVLRAMFDALMQGEAGAERNPF